MIPAKTHGSKIRSALRLAANGQTISRAYRLALVVGLAFVAGFGKRYSYGLVLILHGISTLSSWKQYLDPFNNLLFFAAWPMLAACMALYMLRDLDTRWTIDSRLQ